MVARTRGWIKKYGKPNEETWELGAGEGPTRNISADITKIAGELRHANRQVNANSFKWPLVRRTLPLGDANCGALRYPISGV